MKPPERPVIWDVEFSLALHNRTGKFQIGAAILENHSELIAQVHYWRQRSETVPVGLHAKLLGKSLQTEVKLRQANKSFNKWRRIRSARSMLHLDPFTVVLHALQPEDLVLCHDMGPISHPHLFDRDVVTLYSHAYHEISQVGPRMAFVSESSRLAYEQRFGPLEHTSVIYPPIRQELSAVEPARPKALPERFLLSVGSMGARKNQASMIRAYGESDLADKAISLVLCGSREPGFEDVQKAAEATHSVHLLPYVSEAELAWLYRNASGFVLVSKLEGFGMPVAEAIDNSLVPLISNESVLQEVAGPGALTADPDDQSSIAAGLIKLGNLNEDEKASRMLQLKAAVGRFTNDVFVRNWAHLLATGGIAEQRPP